LRYGVLRVDADVASPSILGTVARRIKSESGSWGNRTAIRRVRLNRGRQRGALARATLESGEKAAYSGVR
jgi:hypothetical protein